jgi:hypothetical protein
LKNLAENFKYFDSKICQFEDFLRLRVEKFQKLEIWGQFGDNLGVLGRLFMRPDREKFTRKLGKLLGRNLRRYSIKFRQKNLCEISKFLNFYKGFFAIFWRFRISSNINHKFSVIRHL